MPSINILYPPDQFSSTRNLGVYGSASTASYGPGDIAIVKLNLDYSGGAGTDIRYSREVYPQPMGPSFIWTYSYTMLAISASTVRLNAELWTEDSAGNRTKLASTYVDLHDIHA